MSEKSQRLLKIYNLLKRRPVTIESLKTWAEDHHIQISERTFYRDLWYWKIQCWPMTSRL